MAVISTGDVTLPTNIADGIVEKSKFGGTVGVLSGQEPMRFGETSIITFDDDLTAEFVEENAAKSDTGAAPSAVKAVPHKTVVNFRTSNEFMWADEDYQLGILDKLEQKSALALARALDFGLYYRINPRTGNAITSWTNYLNTTTNRVEAGSDSDLDVEAAAGLVIGEGATPNGIAFDPSYAWTLSTARYNDGRKKFPELGLGLNVSNFEGLNASVSDTVSARPEAADNGVKAIVGDFQSGIRWGVQKSIPFELIEYGDPDNTGKDLKGYNQVLFRLELVYGWYVFPDRFSVIEAAADGGGE